MFERAAKLQQKLPLSPSSTTLGHPAISGPIPETGPLRPAAHHLPHRQTQSRANPAPIEIKGYPTKAPLGSHDAEKKPCERRSPSSAHILSYNHARVTYADDEGDEGDDESKEHAIWILVSNPPTSSNISAHQHVPNQQIYLSILSPLLTLPIALYTLLVGTLLFGLSPLCFCLKQLSICARLRRILSPLLVFQLGLVYSAYDIGDPGHSETSGMMVLVLVSILSPLYAMVISVATWVAGVFWFYTAILGNPDGREDRDDGREAVLAVRGWWERWLVQSLKPEDHSINHNAAQWIRSGC